MPLCPSERGLQETLISTMVLALRETHSEPSPSQVEEGRVTLLAELLVLLTLRATHSFHHLFIQLHGRRKRLGISAQDIPKIYVEEFAWM